MAAAPLTPMERATLEHNRIVALTHACLRERKDSFCEMGRAYCREKIVEYRGVFYQCPNQTEGN